MASAVEMEEVIPFTVYTILFSLPACLHSTTLFVILNAAPHYIMYIIYTELI